MLVIHNARIYTQNPAQPFATALAIDQGSLLAVGQDDQILPAFVTSKSLNANGSVIIPGLTDAHIHLEDYAFAQQKINCETETREECLQRLAERVITARPGEWVMGHGWNQNKWPEGYGDASMLDEICPHNPVFLTHKSLHSAWLNTTALHLAGIDRNTPDPPGGRIRHDDLGEPDGILYESAVSLVEETIPEPNPDQVVQALRSIQPALWKFGLTGVHDFGPTRTFSALQAMRTSQELKLRVVKSIPSDNLSEAITSGLHTGFGDEMLQIGSHKLFADGALGPQTAAMLQPYEANPHNRGMLMLDAQELYGIGKVAVGSGISLAVHAIGDRANRDVLDAYAQIRQYERSIPSPSSSLLRHRIEHVQVVHPDDLHRFSELDIIASMQPLHATSDMHMADRHWGERSAFAYAWRSLLSHGSMLIFGSDAPVETPNPFLGIHAAVTRRPANDSSTSPGWYPQQCLSVAEAIRAYTAGPARAAQMELRLGQLTAGYLADLIIVNDDPYLCPAEELANIHSEATMVGGEWVYTRLE